MNANIATRIHWLTNLTARTHTNWLPSPPHSVAQGLLTIQARKSRLYTRTNRTSVPSVPMLGLIRT